MHSKRTSAMVAEVPAPSHKLDALHVKVDEGGILAIKPSFARLGRRCSKNGLLLGSADDAAEGQLTS